MFWSDAFFREQLLRLRSAIVQSQRISGRKCMQLHIIAPALHRAPAAALSFSPAVRRALLFVLLNIHFHIYVVQAVTGCGLRFETLQKLHSEWNWMDHFLRMA